MSGVGAHYAECVDCSATFANGEEARAHGDETMAPTGEPGIVASGHAWRVVNPTPEEESQRRVRRVVINAVDDAIYDAINSLDSAIDRGDISEDEVREQLSSYPDFRDAWEEDHS